MNIVKYLWQTTDRILRWCQKKICFVMTNNAYFWSVYVDTWVMNTISIIMLSESFVMIQHARCIIHWSNSRELKNCSTFYVSIWHTHVLVISDDICVMNTQVILNIQMCTERVDSFSPCVRGQFRRASSDQRLHELRHERALYHQ